MRNKDSVNPHEIEKLRERHKTLEKDKITAEANLETSKNAFENLKRQARESYGTDDLEKLRKMLEEMKHKNEQKRIDYQKHLDEIEDRLAEVERQHTGAAKQESHA